MKRKHPLRRIILGTAATVSGVVLLLALKQPGSEPVAAAGQQNPAQAPQAPATAPAAPGGGGGGGGGGGARTVTGDAAQTQYGPVQVSVTVSGGKVTGATAVKTPDSGPQSEQIAADSVPKLNQAALTAQSAKIDTVSGATYTSEGYRKSLQSALDKAGL
ncbi:FMN-binding protein [Streptomyces sp. ME19-01-6]|uniref:FMN-binding protein n=1 Tax=Streptomyces sp. ME19-01-6 TaxID=3028686 RepID=UPI0029AC717A|nr:FMN-binding protein [Streptomyces sp. ME19-01-6]MDX3228541.1 FMN-binding protein [Streptomyces sp. ME19-01-6]